MLTQRTNIRNADTWEGQPAHPITNTDHSRTKLGFPSLELSPISTSASQDAVVRCQDRSPQRGRQSGTRRIVFRVRGAHSQVHPGVLAIAIDAARRRSVCGGQTAGHGLLDPRDQLPV
jgi:hypothetical protein